MKRDTFVFTRMKSAVHFKKINENLGKKLKKVHKVENMCTQANKRALGRIIKKNGTVLYFSKRALRGDLHIIENR